MRRLRCILGLHAWTTSLVVAVGQQTITANWSCACGAQRAFVRERGSPNWRDMDRGGALASCRWAERSTDAVCLVHAARQSGAVASIPLEVR